jgi:hypothetical protein
LTDSEHQRRGISEKFVVDQSGARLGQPEYSEASAQPIEHSDDEAADPSVSIDLIVRSLLRMGVNRKDVAAYVGNSGRAAPLKRAFD